MMETVLEHWGVKLDELEHAGSDNWEALKTGVDKAWSELEVAFDEPTR
jgi:hypothetical protein